MLPSTNRKVTALSRWKYRFDSGREYQYAAVLQMVEGPAVARKAAGSNPVRSAIYFRLLSSRIIRVAQIFVSVSPLNGSLTF